MKFGGFTPLTLIDYPGKVAAMVYTIGCNFRCPYCHNPELVDETVEETFDEDDVIAFLESRHGLLAGVVITGGEPTMHGEDLLSFMKRVKALGLSVKLDTNGTNPSFVREAEARGVVDYIAMDVKAPIDSYYKTAGRPVDVAAIRESIALLMENAVPYEFRTTVLKALLSPDDVEAIARDIRGAAQYYLQKFIPTKTLNPQFKRKVSYTDEEFDLLKKRAEPYVAHCAIR